MPNDGNSGNRVLYNTSDLWIMVYVHLDTLEPLHTMTYDRFDWSDEDAYEGWKLCDEMIRDQILEQHPAGFSSTGLPPGISWEVAA